MIWQRPPQRLTTIPKSLLTDSILHLLMQRLLLAGEELSWKPCAVKRENVGRGAERVNDTACR